MWAKDIKELEVAAAKLYFLQKEDADIKSEEFAKEALSRFANKEPSGFIIIRNRYGKPYLKDYSGLHFNISHTRGIMVCAVSERSVGIDVERVRPLNRRIASRFFTDKERQYIFASQEGQDKRFCEIWTRKEAYVKWNGKGMALPFNSFDVMDDRRIVTFYIDSYICSICN